MKRQAQAVVLFLIGGTVIQAGLTDLSLRYVKAGLRPFLIVAGVVLVAAAVATVWYEMRGARGRAGVTARAASSADGRPEAEGRPEPGSGGRGDLDGAAEPDEPGGCEAAGAPGGSVDGAPGGHTHREPRIAWLLALPVLALILVAPPAPGSYSANRSGTALKPPPGFPELPADGTLKLSVIDYAGRAAFDRGRSLDDRKIKLTGFITLDGNGAPYLSRMTLNCCAADAQPVKVGLAGRIPPALQPDTWLEVTGKYTKKKAKDPVNDGVIPYVEVSGTRPVKAPKNEYEN